MPSVPTIDTKPLYAIAGAGDFAVETLRARATVLQTQVKHLPSRAQTRRVEVTKQAQSLPTELRKQVTEVPTTLRKQVEDLTATLRKQPETLRKQADELGARVASRYADLADRGEKVVAGLRGDSVKSADKPTAKKPSTKPATRKPAAKAPVAEGPAATTEAPSPSPIAPATPAFSATPIDADETPSL
jgi:hypothetical protein